MMIYKQNSKLMNHGNHLFNLTPILKWVDIFYISGGIIVKENINEPYQQTKISEYGYSLNIILSTLILKLI